MYGTDKRAAIVLKVLAERGELQAPTGTVALALLIFEDLAAVLMVLLVLSYALWWGLSNVMDQGLAALVVAGVSFAFNERIVTRASSTLKVWEGTVDVANELNREMTTAIPVGELEAKLEPGAYVLTARAVNDTGNDWEARATQWFVVTDLGLTTLNGNDGLHVMVRSLGSAPSSAVISPSRTSWRASFSSDLSLEMCAFLSRGTT